MVSSGARADAYIQVRVAAETKAVAGMVGAAATSAAVKARRTIEEQFDVLEVEVKRTKELFERRAGEVAAGQDAAERDQNSELIPAHILADGQTVHPS